MEHIKERINNDKNIFNYILSFLLIDVTWLGLFAP